MAARLDADAREKLEEELMALEGVRYAAVDTRSGTQVWVIRDPAHDHAPLEISVRNRLAGLGHDPSGLDVKITVPVGSGPRRRVRFEGVERTEESGRVTITVSLEWGGEIFSGESTGERGPAIELKTTARAAVHALERLSGESLGLRIIGVKPVHAFDSDLMVASLYRSTGIEQRLVGAVLVTEDPLSATAVAVLSALNRTLGNFLHTAD